MYSLRKPPLQPADHTQAERTEEHGAGHGNRADIPVRVCDECSIGQVNGSRFNQQWHKWGKRRVEQINDGKLTLPRVGR